MKTTGQEAMLFSPTKTKVKELVVVTEKEMPVVEGYPRTVVRVLQEQEVEKSIVPPGPQFFGNVREWYETLVETVADASNILYRAHPESKEPSVIETSPEICTILEHLVAFRSNRDEDGDHIGTLNNR
jgi:hypothetical protein